MISPMNSADAMPMCAEGTAFICAAPAEVCRNPEPAPMSASATPIRYGAEVSFSVTSTSAPATWPIMPTTMTGPAPMRSERRPATVLLANMQAGAIAKRIPETVALSFNACTMKKGNTSVAAPCPMTCSTRLRLVTTTAGLLKIARSSTGVAARSCCHAKSAIVTDPGDRQPNDAERGNAPVRRAVQSDHQRGQPHKDKPRAKKVEVR